MIIAVFVSLVSIGLLCFSVGLRTRIASLLRGAGLYIAGSWNVVWPVIRRTAIVAAIIGGSGWVLLVVLMAAIGVYASSFWSAVIISLLFPIWFAAFIMPPILNRVWLIGPIFRIVRLVFSPILIIALFFLLVGIWSPAIKGSWDRWSENKKQEVANSFDKSSLKSEPEMGVFARVTADSQVYNQAGNPRFFVQKGTVVKMTDHRGKRANANSEGMVKVMLPNRHGDYQMGNEGWIPTRKLDWDWQVKTDSPPAPTEKVKVEEKLTSLPATVRLTGDRRWPAEVNVPSGNYCVTCWGSITRKFIDTSAVIPPEGRSPWPEMARNQMVFPHAERYGEVLAELPEGRVVVIGKQGKIQVQGGGKIRFTQNLSYFFSGNTGEVSCKIERI